MSMNDLCYDARIREFVTHRQSLKVRYLGRTDYCSYRDGQTVTHRDIEISKSTEERRFIHRSRAAFCINLSIHAIICTPIKKRKRKLRQALTLKMLLPKPKPNIPARHALASPANPPSRDVGPAEINADIRAQRALEATAQIAMIQNAIAHAGEQPLEIGTAEIGAGFEFGEGIVGGADGVEHDVGRGVEIEPLGQVGVDFQEFDSRGAWRGCRGRRLGFERGQEGLEPFEGRGVATDPDEFHATQPTRWIRAGAEVPDVFEDGSPGGDADAGADEDGDFVVEDVFGGGAVGSVDAEARHRLPVLDGDLVHAHRVEAFEFFGLDGAGAEGVAEGAGEVADLADVDGDVGVEGAGGDGEGVPLVAGDGGHVDEEPLPGFVAHGGLPELDFHRVWMRVSSCRR